MTRLILLLLIGAIIFDSFIAAGPLFGKKTPKERSRKKGPKNAVPPRKWYSSLFGCKVDSTKDTATIAHSHSSLSMPKSTTTLIKDVDNMDSIPVKHLVQIVEYFSDIEQRPVEFEPFLMGPHLQTSPATFMKRPKQPVPLEHVPLFSNIPFIMHLRILLKASTCLNEFSTEAFEQYFYFVLDLFDTRQVKALLPTDAEVAADILYQLILLDRVSFIKNENFRAWALAFKDYLLPAQVLPVFEHIGRSLAFKNGINVPDRMLDFIFMCTHYSPALYFQRRTIEGSTIWTDMAACIPLLLHKTRPAEEAEQMFALFNEQKKYKVTKAHWNALNKCIEFCQFLAINTRTTMEPSVLRAIFSSFTNYSNLQELEPYWSKRGYTYLLESALLYLDKTTDFGISPHGACLIILSRPQIYQNVQKINLEPIQNSFTNFMQNSDLFVSCTRSKNQTLFVVDLHNWLQKNGFESFCSSEAFSFGLQLFLFKYCHIPLSYTCILMDSEDFDWCDDFAILANGLIISYGLANLYRVSIATEYPSSCSEIYHKIA